LKELLARLAAEQFSYTSLEGVVLCDSVHHARLSDAGGETYIVPVRIHAYADDSLDGRDSGTSTFYAVKVTAADPKSARTKVYKEWGQYSMSQVGSAVPAP